MRTRGTELPGGGRSGARRSAALCLALLLVALLLSSCSVFEDDPSESPTASEDVTADVRGLLRKQARAVRGGKMTAFLSHVDPGRPKLVKRQKRWFLNLQELPLARLAWRVPDGSVTEEDGGLRAVVELKMQLKGYDAVPVLTPQLLRFDRDEDGRLVLVDDRDPAFLDKYDIEPSPWDLTRIEVEEGDGVLGIFDAGSVDAAYQIIPAVERGTTTVGTEVPLDWDRKVVVYALSDLRMLESLDNLPGGDPDRLDGVAFPVSASPRSRKLAATRFMLHPRMIDRNDQVRDRLIRHELTHVALGRRDDRIPTWLSEGLAEYVSVQPIPTYRRLIARAALTQAEAGLTSLPRNKTFNGEESGAHYGIAWYACEFIATTYGEDALWRLFDVMREGDGTEEKEQDAVLLDVLGIDSGDLAESAGRKIVNTFG